MKIIDLSIANWDLFLEKIIVNLAKIIVNFVIMKFVITKL